MRSVTFVSLLLLFFSAGTALAFTVKDDLGEEYEFDVPVQRIISLSPHITELLFSIGAGDSVIGVSDYSDYPDAAKKLPRVSSYQTMNVEAILVMQPDVIIAWPSSNSQKALEQLQAFGIPVLFSNPNSHQEIIDNLRWMGKLVGKEAFANRLAKQKEEQIQQLFNQYASKKTVSLFYQISFNPLMTQNKTAFINQAIELCGGENLFADLPALSPVLDREAVIERDPEMIFASVSNNHVTQALEYWQSLPFLTAVKNEHLYLLPADLMHRPTLRFFEGTRKMCELIDQAR